MKSLRPRGWQPVVAAFCSILAVVALSFWMPSATGADPNAQREDLAMRDTGPGVKGTVPAIESKVPAPTNEAIVYLKPGQNAAHVALAHGLIVKNHFKSDPNIVVMAAPDLQRASLAQPGLTADARVKAVYPNHRSQHVRFQVPAPWNPNDEYFLPHTNNGFRFPGMWHLDNQADLDPLLTGATNGVDVNIRGAWNRGWTGFYINIGIVDDGLSSPTKTSRAPTCLPIAGISARGLSTASLARIPTRAL